MKWLRPEIEDEFNRVENSIKKFMIKQYPWIEDINIDKESFQKNKTYETKNKKETTFILG